MRWEEITGGRGPETVLKGRKGGRASTVLGTSFLKRRAGWDWLTWMQESLRKTLAQKVSHPLCLLQQRKWPHLLECRREKHSALHVEYLGMRDRQARLEHGLWPVARSGNTGVARHRDEMCRRDCSS